MAEKWMQEAFARHKGQLHRDLGVPQGQRIGQARLAEAAKRKGKIGQRARAAINAMRANARR